MKKSGKKTFLQSKEWKELRGKAVKRDGGKCFLCGSDEGVTVHHVLPRRCYSKLKLELRNCICLCRSCHWHVHKGGYSLKLYDKIARTRK